jgi:DNA-binding IclR family transcriptional regulator
MLKSDDPEFVYVNVAFIALAHPPSRRVLELLAVGPRDLRDFQAHVGFDINGIKQLLEELVMVGFVTVTAAKGVGIYELGGPAIDRVKAWMSLLP